MELRTISDPKSGKEGPVPDYVCCAVTNAQFEFKLSIKGETQADNVYALLNTLPNLKHNVRITFAPGNGKLSFVKAMHSRGLQIITFAATLGSYHPCVGQNKIYEFRDRLQGSGYSMMETENLLRGVDPRVVDKTDFSSTLMRISCLISAIRPETMIPKKNLKNDDMVYATAT